MSARIPRLPSTLLVHVNGVGAIAVPSAPINRYVYSESLREPTLVLPPPSTLFAGTPAQYSHEPQSTPSPMEMQEHIAERQTTFSPDSASTQYGGHPGTPPPQQHQQTQQHQQYAHVASPLPAHPTSATHATHPGGLYDASQSNLTTSWKNKTGPGRVKRPMNSFMLFASQHRRQLLDSRRDLSNNEVSRVLGDAWATLEPHARAYYESEAQRLAMEHRLRHPGHLFERRVSKAKTLTAQRAPRARSYTQSSVESDQSGTAFHASHLQSASATTLD